MRLHKVHLRNFRQFRSESITFAQGGDQNVTVVHGQNGAGKTTLKNAITWVLYGEVDFVLRPSNLASQGALAEVETGDAITVEVTLEFEHEDIDYELVRWVEYQRQSRDDFEGELIDEGLTLTYQTPAGDRGTRSNPQDSLQQMLPDRLSDLFFFDGEYITQLSERRSQDEIREAIQNIMGLKIIERSIKHLGDVEKQFEEELEKNADSGLKNLLDERNELKDRKEDKQQALEAAEETRDALELEIRDIKQKLERIDDSEALEEKRSELEDELDQTEAEIDDLNERLEQSISTKGHLPFAMPAVEQTAKDLNRLREEGVLPSEVSNSFVDSLLEREECLCGRPLNEGTDEYERVVSYRSEDATEGFDQAAMRIISHLPHLDSECEEYFETVSTLLSERSDLRDEAQGLAEEISEISAELEGIDTTDPETGEKPSDLEASRKRKVEKLDSVKEDIVRHEVKIEDLEEELKEVNKQIKEARQDQAEAELARKRMRAAQATRKQLEASFDQLQNKVRGWSNTLVKETFDEIATKDYEAEITEEFELRIKDRLQGEYLEVEKSRGERQIASLTFIGSLVQIAKERYESSSDAEYFSGGVYPILMDSPFGALDDEHRRQVSRVIPRMADQVIVLVTDSQWRGPVANELADIAGQQYRLSFEPGDGATTYPHTTIEAETTTEVR